MSFGYANVR